MDLPLKAKLVVKKDTYKLDLDGKSGEEFRKLHKDAEKSGVEPPRRQERQGRKEN